MSIAATMKRLAVNPSNSANQTIRVTTHNVGTAKKAIEYGWLDFAARFDSDVICLQSLTFGPAIRVLAPSQRDMILTFALGDVHPVPTAWESYRGARSM